MQTMYEIFNNRNVLNIFCDASLKPRGNTTDICYGCIVVVEDTIIDSICRINSGCTSNYGEAKGMSAALYMATKYKNKFPVINIFCDSLYTVETMNNYYRNWTVDMQGQVYSKHELVPNQSPFIESMKTIIENQLVVNIFHQKGHVDYKSFKDVNNATNVFARTNKIKRKIDYGFIRFISGYNNLIDQYTRSALLRFDNIDNKVVTPFTNLIDSRQLSEYKSFKPNKDILYK